MKTLDISASVAQSATAPVSKQLPASKQQDLINIMLPALFGAVAGMIMLIIVGLMLVGQAGTLTLVSSALFSAQSAWYLSRASAFAAYILLWWSMVLGLSMTSKLTRLWSGGPMAGALHEQASLLGLALTAVHGLTLLADQYIGYSLAQILIPFTTSYLPLCVGIGQVSMYLMALVTASFYVRRWIGNRTWKAIHLLSFLVFVLALGHGLFSGTDSGMAWALIMYAVTGISVVAMTVYRIMASQKV